MATFRRPVLTKIRRPHVAPDALVRPGPISLLDQVPKHRVTLVTSPAGFGKSWLVSDWLDWRADWHQSWVTVDAYDHDPVRLWLHIVESIEQSEASEAAQLLAAGQSGLSRVIDALVSDLEGRTEPTVVVLDDIHRLTGDESRTSLTQFLTALPASTHVVMVGRHDPELPLAKWRLAGDLLEIRTADLRCTLEETQELVTDKLGLVLEPEVVAGLHAKTKGWIAGLRLIAPATARSRDPGRHAGKVPGVATLDGGYDTLGAYLVEEVLKDVDDSDRQFLFDTSILGDLTPHICNEVSGRSDSAEMLERLARSGMFVSRIDGSDRRYRYHDLFRDAIETQLHRTMPRHEREVHRRAAMYLHDHHDPVAAVDHALKADLPDLAAQWLVSSSRQMLMSQQFATMRTLFGRIAEASDTLSTNVLVAWCYPVLYGDGTGAQIDDILSRTLDSIETMIKNNDVEQLAELAQNPGVIRGTPSELMTRLAAMLAHRHGDTVRAFQLLDDLAEPSDGGRVEGAAGEMLIYLGRINEGLDRLTQYNEYVFSTRNPMVASQTISLTLQAWAALGKGQLSRADSLAARGVEIMESHGLGAKPYAAVATVPLAWVAYERGDLDVASALITPSLDPLGRFGEIPAYVFAHMLVARISHARGEHRAAQASLDRARILPSGRIVAGYFADRIRFEEARLALLNGDLAAAEIALGDWRGRLQQGATTMDEHLLLARFLIASGGDPTPFLDTSPTAVDFTTVHRIEVHKLRAHHAMRDGNETLALDALTEAMSVAVPTGHTQTFLDDAPIFGALLDNAAARSGHRLRRNSNTAATVIGRPPEVTLVQPLTARELEVLALLPSHLTYADMGEALFVSTNTIKSYVKDIYRKLNADKRYEAVANARALGLIE